MDPMKVCIRCAEFTCPGILDEKQLNQTGTCQLCGAKDIAVGEIGDAPLAHLRQSATAVAELYEPSNESSASLYNAMTLDAAFSRVWHFPPARDAASQFSCSWLLPDSDMGRPMRFRHDREKALQDCSILNAANMKRDGAAIGSWEEFVDLLKHRRRLCQDYVNTENLRPFISATTRCIKKGTLFWRARVSKDGRGFAQEEMGAPPAHLAKDGRANASGIPVLYLSGNRDVAVAEVRPGYWNVVTAAGFELQQDCEVADVRQLHDFRSWSPRFQKEACSAGKSWIDLFVANAEQLAMMAEDLRRPFQSDPLEYLSSQYLCEFVQSMGYDGVMYGSAVRSTGFNIVLFDNTMAKSITCEDLRITELMHRMAVRVPLLRQTAAWPHGRR